MKRVTIKDLAAMLNLSASTVSRALSNHPDISDATKKRVKKTAEAFNYRTNIGARLLRKQRSGLIALVLPEINMFFTPNLIRGINESIIKLDNYSLITFLTNDSFKREEEIIKQCLNWSVEGVLISLSRETKNLDHLSPLLETGVKCVLLDKAVENTQCPSITINSVDAAYENVKYLIHKGHRHILGVFDNPNFLITQERIKGFETALKENDIAIIQENIVTANNITDLDDILPNLLTKQSKVSAVFVMSDELLAKTLYHIKASGRSIPEDISVTVISDGDYPKLTYPQTSHTKDSGFKMGKVAIKFLLEMIRNPKDSFDSRIIKTKLIELGSVRDLNA